MKSPIVVSVLGLLMFISVSGAAFDVDNYLFSDELPDDVEYLDFTLNETQYSIISISGEETFLLKEGELLNSSGEINDAIHLYYQKIYYPAPEDIIELRELISTYNESRNDGGKFKNQEEYTCRSVIFIDGRVKSGSQPIYCRNEDDEEMCIYSAMLMYQFLSSVTGTPPVASYEDLLGPIKDFGYASYGTDEVLSNMVYKLDEAEEDQSKMYDAISYIISSIPTLENYADDIEDCMFGWTETGGCDSDHWCLCPDMHMDRDALEDMEDKSEEILCDIGPFSEYSEVSLKIKDNTDQRLSYYEQEITATGYESEFRPLEEKGGEIISDADGILTHATNSTLSTDLQRLRELNTTINSKIENRNFTNIELDISEFEYTMLKVNKSTSEIAEVYNELKDKKNTADSLLIVLSTKDFHGYSGEKAEGIINDITELDSLFSGKMTIQEMNSLSENYEQKIEEGNELLVVQQTEPTSGSFSAFRAFAKDVNTEIANFAESSDIVEKKTIEQHETAAFGGFAVVVFLSLAALCLVLFLSLTASSRFFNTRTRIITVSAFVFILLSIGLFSFGLYYYMDKTATDATAEEFMEDFKTSEDIAVVMDLTSTSGTESEPIESCGMELVEFLEEQNKTVTGYRMYSDKCIKTVEGQNGTFAVWECEEEIEAQAGAVVRLMYSQTNEEPEFSTVFRTEAIIKSNSDYYTTCPVVALFK